MSVYIVKVELSVKRLFVLECFGCPLKAPWVVLGASWEPLGGLLDAFWQPFGAAGDLWEAFWGVLKASWGAQNGFREGSMFKAFSKCLFKTILEPSWGRLGFSWAHLGGRKFERLAFSPPGGVPGRGRGGVK